MGNKSVFMDTNIFSSIVEDIRGSAIDCAFPCNALSQAPHLDTFSAGRSMHEDQKTIHETDEVYRSESSEALPGGFLKMKDSMLAVDKAASEALVVNGTNNADGGVREL